MPAPVSQTIGPPAEAWTEVCSKDANSNLEYRGRARCRQPVSTVTVTTASNANPCVITATAHGLQDRNSVTISGFAGNWAAANGTHTITWVDANSFSIAVDSSAFGAFGAQAPVVTTSAPRLTAACWAIERLFYDAGNFNTRSTWADGNTADDNIFNNASSLSYR